MSIPLGFVAAEGAEGGGEEGRRLEQRAEGEGGKEAGERKMKIRSCM